MNDSIKKIVALNSILTNFTIGYATEDCERFINMKNQIHGKIDVLHAIGLINCSEYMTLYKMCDEIPENYVEIICEMMDRRL